MSHFHEKLTCRSCSKLTSPYSLMIAQNIHFRKIQVYFATLSIMMRLLSTWLLLVFTTHAANFETQCFDLDPLQYCSDLDTSITITDLINEMKVFTKFYDFYPYGMVYNVSVINTTDDTPLSNVYILGIHKLTTTSQVQWDISSFFMDLILNKTARKLIFVDSKTDGLGFGLDLYDHVMNSNATKYLEYIDAIYDDASSPIDDRKAFVDLVNSNSLQHRFTMSSYLGMTVQHPMSAEIQQSVARYAELFEHTESKQLHSHSVKVVAMDSVEDSWSFWVREQVVNRDKLYKTQYQTLFQKYFDLMDSVLSYSYWYQDSNLYDAVFRWKQKSYFIFQRWLFRAHCIEIERDNRWMDKVTDSVLYQCTLGSGSKSESESENDSETNESERCDNIIITETYHVERMIERLEKMVNDKMNSNEMVLDVHRIKVDWLNHVNEDTDREAIESAVKEAVKSFIEDLELFVSWQSQT